MKNEKPYTRLITPAADWQDTRYVNRRKPRPLRWIMRCLTGALTIASIASIAACWTAPGVLDVLGCVAIMLTAFASALLTP